MLHPKRAQENKYNSTNGVKIRAHELLNGPKENFGESYK
jgi:hypothetical protein